MFNSDAMHGGLQGNDYQEVDDMFQFSFAFVSQASAWIEN